MIGPDDVDSLWVSEFPGHPPVAYALRCWFPLRWVRFHSLPESKRYPENEDEMATVLHRHNSVLNGLLEGQEQVALLSTGYSESTEPVQSELMSRGLFAESTHWRAVDMRSITQDWDNPTFHHIWLTSLQWREGALDAVFRLTADFQIADTMLLSLSRKFVYHPYDGGADVILRTSRERDRLKQRHRAWLSDHPEGL